MTDYLQQLAQVPAIAEVCNASRKQIDDVQWNRELRKQDDSFTTYIRRMSGYATAALDGAVMADDPMREPDASAMGDVANQGLAITAAADLEAATFMHSPMQVWARLHSIIDQSQERGRPRTSEESQDPLHLGPAIPADVMHERLTQLAQTITVSQAPAVLVSAITHAELAILRPFTHGSYLVARASVRMILAGKHVDEKTWSSPEFGMYSLGRARYVTALRAYSSGTIEGITELVRWHSSAIEAGIAGTLVALVGRNK
jgi:hypothetical protein